MHGKVKLVGGPAPRPAQPGWHYARVGEVLVFATADRAGGVLQRAEIDSGGSFCFPIAPGIYHLATTAAISDGRPFGGPLVSVAAGERVEADIVCPVR